MGGQVKSVKPCLKQLQQSILTIMQPSWPSDEGLIFIRYENINHNFCSRNYTHLIVLRPSR